MNDKILYWLSMGFGVLALVLLVTNISLILSNRGLQNQYANQQATINNGVTLSQLNQSLVQALAQASLDNDDKEIRNLLSAQGITVTRNKEGAK